MNTIGVNGEWLKKALAVQGWMAEHELQWLHAAASNMDEVVEVGAWKGRSTIALAAGAKKVYSVDTWKGTPSELDSYHKDAKDSDIFAEFIKNTVELGNVAPMISLSTTAPEKIGKKVDMVFVDADHSADATEADIKAWLPFCKKMMCGHDFDQASVREGVYRCFDRREVVRAAGNLWYVDLTVPVDTRDAIAVCIPGPHFSRAWLAQWNDLFIHLYRKFRVYLYYAESNNIYQVRNIVAKAVLASPERPKYILWIDSDNLVSVHGFEELYAAAEATPEEVGAVGAWYRFFGPNGTLIAAGTGPELRPTEEQLATLPGLLQVGYIGFGFLLMRYEMLEAMGEKAFLPYLDNGEFCTDDGGFCDRAREKGFKFFVHPKVFAPHLKLGEVSAIRPIS